jgi:hypothetical protein
MGEGDGATEGEVVHRRQRLVDVAAGPAAGDRLLHLEAWVALDPVTVARRREDYIHRAGLEIGDGDGWVRHDIPTHLVEVRKGRSGRVLAPVFGVLDHGQVVALRPLFELEGAGADGIPAGILAELLDRGRRDDRTAAVAQVGQQRRVRLLHDEGHRRVVDHLNLPRRQDLRAG